VIHIAGYEREKGNPDEKKGFKGRGHKEIHASMKGEKKKKSKVRGWGTNATRVP